MHAAQRGVGVEALSAVQPQHQVSSDAGRFVKHHPFLDPVAKPFGAHLGESGEVLDDASAGPAALLPQGQRNVPVVDGHPWLHARFQGGVDDPVVEVGALRVQPLTPGTHQAWPRQRDAVGTEAEVLDHLDVLGIPVVEVDALIAPRRRSCRCGSAHPRSTVPYRQRRVHLRSERPLRPHPR